jgi:hypothetical protein
MMGNLLDLLQAAAGEASLRTRLGAWRQAISQSVDSVAASVAPLAASVSSLAASVASLAASGSAALAATQYMQATQVGGNALVQLNTDLVLNTLAISRGIPYNPVTGIATLTAGRTYSLRASGTLVTFAGAGASAFFDITWVDAVSNAPLDANAVGTWMPVADAINGSANEAPSDAVEVLYQPASNQTVKLRSTASGGGTAQALAGHFWSAITQIG